MTLNNLLEPLKIDINIIYIQGSKGKISKKSKAQAVHFSSIYYQYVMQSYNNFFPQLRSCSSKPNTSSQESFFPNLHITLPQAVLTTNPYLKPETQPNALKVNFKYMLSFTSITITPTYQLQEWKSVKNTSFILYLLYTHQQDEYSNEIFFCFQEKKKFEF